MVESVSKYQRYAEYKDSGVEWLGKVPSHWDILSIARISNKITNGYVGATRDIFFGSGVRYLQSLHIKNNTINFHTPYYVSESWSNEKSKSILKQGDVLIVQTGDIGQVAAVTKEFEGCNCHALIIVSGTEKISGFYLAWFLNSNYGRQTLKSIQTGALHPHLNCDAIKDIKITLPDIYLQKTIANFLDHETAKIDSLIEKQKQLIQLLKEKRQAVISHAVTKGLDPSVKMKDSGVEWLREVPEHWKVTRFSYEIFYQEGPGILAVDFHETGIPLLRIQNVKSDFVSNDYKTYLLPSKVLAKWDHYRVDKGDLIISCSASTGLVSEVDESTVGAIPYTGLIRLKPRTRKIMTPFIKLLVQSDLFFEQIEVLQTGSTIQHFGPFHLQQMYISLPPFEEQEFICSEVQSSMLSLASLISKAESAIHFMLERRTALISAAVTGKIDVRNWQNPIDAKTELSA